MASYSSFSQYSSMSSGSTHLAALTPNRSPRSANLCMKSTGYPERLGLIEDSQFGSCSNFTGPGLYASLEPGASVISPELHSTSPVNCGLLPNRLCKLEMEQRHYDISKEGLKVGTLTQQSETVACKLMTITDQQRGNMADTTFAQPLESPSISTSRSLQSKKHNISESAPDATEEEQEVHIWTERERRKRMRTMFVTLNSMLPNSSAKADKSTIVDEAINYIKSLERNLQKMIRCRAERGNMSCNANNSMLVLNSYTFRADSENVAKEACKISYSSNLLTKDGFLTWCSSNVALNISGADAFFTIRTVKRLGLLSELFEYIMERHQLDIRSVQISNTKDLGKRLYMIHAQFFGDSLVVCKNLKVAVEDLTTLISKGDNILGNMQGFEIFDV